MLTLTGGGVPLSRAPASALPAAKPTPPDSLPSAPPENSGTRQGPHVRRPGSPCETDLAACHPSAPAAASVRCDSRRAGAGHFSGACLAESTLTERAAAGSLITYLSPFPPSYTSPLRTASSVTSPENILPRKAFCPHSVRPICDHEPEDSSPTAWKGLVIRTAAAPRASQPLSPLAPRFPAGAAAKR